MGPINVRRVHRYEWRTKIELEANDDPDLGTLQSAN